MNGWDADSGGDSDDPWGEEPDWAVDDGEGDNNADDGNGNGNGNPSRNTSSKNAMATLPGAQHILILLDCHHSMFQPYIQTQTSHDKDQEEEEDDDGSSSKMLSPIDAALIACQQLLHHRVHNVATTRTGKRDGVGIVLFNCPIDVDGSNDGVGECSNMGVRNFIELAPPGVDQIQKIRSYSNANQMSCRAGDTEDSTHSLGRTKDLERELYGSLAKREDAGLDSTLTDSDVELQDQIISLRSALFLINRILTEAKCVKKTSTSKRDVGDSKTVWIFTNQDDPIHGDEEQKEVIQSVCKDLEENDVKVKLWALPKEEGGERFDRGKFYDYVTTLEDEEESDDDNSGEENQHHAHEMNFNKLLEQFCTTWERTRKVQSIPMYLPDWNLHSGEEDTNVAMSGDGQQERRNASYPGIMLDLYQIIRIKKKPQPVTIHSGTRKKTNKTTDILATSTGEIIPPHQLHRFVEFGGERVTISKEDLAQIKSDSNAKQDEASLILLGFKPVGPIPQIQQYPLIERPIFAYPNDNLVEGSRAAFASLHSSMLQKSVVGVGELLQKVTSTSRLVKIVPQEEELSEDGTIQERPPGFLLMPLAYEDDVRAIPETPCSEEDYEAGEDLVSAAEGFINKLRLENLVIGESFENPALKTFWNYMESVALGTPLMEDDPGEDDTTWDEDGILSLCGSEINTFKQLLPEDEIISKVEKKRKVTSIVRDDTGIDWLREFKENTFHDLKAEQLKAYCRSQGEKVGGRKSDLIKRVKDHIQSRLDILSNQSIENA